MCFLHISQKLPRQTLRKTYLNFRKKAEQIALGLRVAQRTF